MAPLLKLLIEFLPALPSTPQWSRNTGISSHHQPAAASRVTSQQHALSPHHISNKAPSIRSTRDQTSSVSWGENRVDIFQLSENNITHKYWNGQEWSPSNPKLETLGNGLATPPVAISWGTNRLDVFGLDDHNVVKHQYWDGTAWQPDVHGLENLGGACDPQFTIAPVTWGENRLDVFCVGLDGDLLHQYYDGSQWQPSAGSLESLGGALAGDVSALTWGVGRFDIFSVSKEGGIAHLYYDGSQWSEWEIFTFPQATFQPDGMTASSWGPDRLDVFATSVAGKLWHFYWDGANWSDAEKLDDDVLLNMASGRAAVTSWAPNRMDVVLARGLEQAYYYKYWDGIGQAWRPSAEGWYGKGTNEQSFSSNPSAVSWGENRLDIFGLADTELVHQAWTGADWYPGAAEWEVLGDDSGEVEGKAEEAVVVTVKGDFQQVELRK